MDLAALASLVAILLETLEFCLGFFSHRKGVRGGSGTGTGRRDKFVRGVREVKGIGHILASERTMI